jgi:phosphoglycerate kinase
VTKRSIKGVDVAGKKVLVRVDFNLPFDIETGTISDDSRIKSALPTIRYLIENNAKIILCSHLGRPDGKKDEALRLKPVAERLSLLIGKPVINVSDCIGKEAEDAIDKLENGQILLLENLRFYPGEEANDPDFAKALAKLADIYVDDAFATAHRAHASVVGVTKYLPAYAGFLMEKEIDVLGKITTNPEHPFCALLGGAKVTDKIGLINNILDKVDLLLIGGGMAATFLAFDGYEVGKSLLSDEKKDKIDELLKLINKKDVTLVLPVDVVVADSIDSKASGKIVPITEVKPDDYIVDIGPKTVEIFIERCKTCRTIFWNGPMGIYEIKQFSDGTRQLANYLAGADAVTVLGGGSTADIVDDMQIADKMTHVSTGGGASLKFLEGKALPGIEVLLDKQE